MSYYDPLYPAYEATKYQIEKTILGLQQKLRRRKELDILLEKDIIQKQALQRQREIINHGYLNHSSRAEQELRQSLRRLRMFDPMRPIISPYTDTLALQKHSLQLDYLQRLNSLRRQRQLLQEEKKLYRQVQKSSPQRYAYQQDSDDILVKKYQDGSKIDQYNRQLQRSSDKKQVQGRQRISSLRNNNQFMSSKQAFGHKIDSNFQTPFDKLRFTQTADKHLSNKLQKEPSYSNSKKRLYEEQQRTKRQDMKKKQQAQPTQPTQQVIKLDNKFQTISPSKSIKKSSRRAVSRSKSMSKLNKSLNKSGIKLDRSRAVTIQQSALKKIQNRLIVSSVIYEDSQYRNNKHQLNHLYSTYENEIKMRKDIKDKINAHPMILRKHAMVVQN